MAGGQETETACGQEKGRSVLLGSVPGKRVLASAPPSIDDGMEAPRDSNRTGLEQTGGNRAAFLRLRVRDGMTALAT